eukprot:symbB.v1.2.027701.t1/scaffold2863.1/size68590/4
MATVADGYNATRLPLRENRPGRPQVPSRLPDEHVNRKDNTLNLEHLISEKRSGLDYGANHRKPDSDKLVTNRLVKDQRIFSNGNSYAWPSRTLSVLVGCEVVKRLRWELG